ncbi:MAG: RNA polymerase sigma factor [Myxococcales bacterium]|nr:RNA polymerase sigma factor [Myxococcales bacterium]
MPKKGDTIDDRTLLQGVACRDRGAFEELVRRHQASVYRFARGLCESDAAAEDALQETLIAAYRNAASYTGASSVRSWLFGIAFRQAQKLRRRRAGEPRFFDSLTDLGVAAGWGAIEDPEELVRAARQRDCLQLALGDLEVEERAVLVLRDIEELSGDETASVLNLSLAAMKSRLHRARLKLAARVRNRRCIDGS